MLVEGRLHIDGVPQHNHVDDDAECVELVFLAFTVTLPQFATFAVEDGAGQPMAGFVCTVARSCSCPRLEVLRSVAFIALHCNQIAQLVSMLARELTHHFARPPAAKPGTSRRIHAP